ncbi:cytochrome ubiquinol oxidase subunit I [Propionibacteriaceae bacterium G57]|uniref:cytochrome ubiquinol oxidase subunit I n=1 Tax=Aestuariimicrobium sp. G57 TaxID=3418485 RepID=UPI003DA6F731
MDAQVIARWQFGITTVYHFFFVPITIGLSMLVAVMQTVWYKTGNDRYLKLTKFYGKLFLINFALGVVTGIVQEFQFGMNWSEYSRFVGDVFGAPLALEALLAFFLESTFLGLWIFGWDKLPKKLHLMAIYCAAIGTMISAIFILAANSWMQNPVGATFRNGRAELTDFGALLTNPVFLATYPHQIAASFMVAGALVAAVGAWHLAKLKPRLKGEDVPEQVKHDAGTWRWASRFGACVLLVASVGVIISGDYQGKVMVEVQPMKMAAAEGHYNTSDGSNFSVLSIGNPAGTEAKHIIEVPGLLGFLSTGVWGDEVQGMNDLREQYANEGFKRNDGSQTELQRTYAAELQKNYPGLKITPNVPVAYWAFRLMMGLGFIGIGGALLILWMVRKDKVPTPTKWWQLAMGVLPFAPLFANSFGWLFTEMGRQPWLVAGVMPTLAGVSPGTSTGEVLFSMIVYTLVYGGLAVLEVGLFFHYMRKGLPEVGPVEVQTDEDAPMSFAY